MMLELDAHEPAFALPDESAEAAVRRVRPVLVILIDGSLEAAASDVFHAHTKGTPVILFGTPRTAARVRALADERGLPWFTVPVDRATFTRVIRDAVASSTTRSGRDRRRPSVHHAPDGTLIYRDRAGGEWQVYDRRAGERRARAAGEEGYRAFVNGAGEEWRYELTDEDAGEVSPKALERQLAKAVKQGG